MISVATGASQFRNFKDNYDNISYNAFNNFAVFLKYCCILRQYRRIYLDGITCLVWRICSELKRKLEASRTAYLGLFVQIILGEYIKVLQGVMGQDYPPFCSLVF